MANNFITEFVKNRSIPEHIKYDDPEFVSFLEAYYTWLSQEKNSADIAINFLKYHDIDTTLDEFVSFFLKELLVSFPVSILSDKRLLAKHIKEFYTNKGNEASYKFLFRILFNEDIEFYYPKIDILRASDGKWVENKILKCVITDVDQAEYFIDKTITGATSGTIAGVESIVTYYERGVLIAEIIINHISGTGFTTGENITVVYNNTPYSFPLRSVYSVATITTPGSGYSVGQILQLKDSTGNIYGTATITKVTTGPILSLSIDSVGYDYNGNKQIINFFSNLPINYTFNGDYLPETSIDEYDHYNVNETITPQTLLGVGDKIIIRDSETSSGYGAVGVIETVGDYGEILEISLLSNGDLYQNPYAEIETTTGHFGTIDVLGGGGGISKIKLNTFPIKLNSDSSNTIFVDYSSYGDGNATGTLSTSTNATYPGKWINEDGHLSSIKKLQDNRYYQDFSYVIQVASSLDKWAKVIKDIIHPAGLELFGQVNLITTTNMTLDYESTIEIIVETTYDISNGYDSSIIKLYLIDAGDYNSDFSNDYYSHVALAPILDSNGNHLVDF